MLIYEYLDVLNKESDFINFSEIQQFTQWVQKTVSGAKFFQLSLFSKVLW